MKTKEKPSKIKNDPNEIYKSLFENSGEAILFTDTDGTIKSVNSEACRIFGGTEEEICNAGRNGLVDINDPRFHLGIEERKRTGMFKGEINFKRIDGTIFPGYVSSVVFKDKEGNERTSMVVRDLSEQKTVEQALKDSEEKFRNLVENSLVGVIQTKVTGEFIFANEISWKMLGFDSLEELTSQGVALRYKFPEDRVKLIELLKKNGIVREFETTILTKNGEEKVLLGNLSINGDVIDGMLIDITKRKKSEESLRESENRLARAENATKIGNWKLMLDSMQIISSEGASNIYGIEKDKMILEDVQKFSLPEYRNMLDKAFKDLIENDIPYNVEFKIRRPNDGNIIDIHSVADFDKENNIVYGVVHDITERKNTELMLRDALEVAHRFREALDHVPAYVYIKDTQSKYLYANKLTLELFGCTAEELIGCDDTSFFPPHTVKHLQDIDKRVFLGEHTTEEVDVINTDGSRKVYWEIKTPIFEDPERNTISGLLGISTDITERKQAEELQKSSNELFKQFMLHSPIYTYIKEVTSDKSLVLQASENFKDMVGIPGSQMVGKTMSELFPAEFAEKMTADDWKVVSNGKVLTLEEELNGKSFTTFKFPIIQGDKTLLAGFTIDITERKLMEEAVKDSEKKYRTLYNNTPVMLHSIDKNGKLISVSDYWLKTMGYKRDEVIGRSSTEFLSEKSRKYAIEIVLPEFMKTGYCYNIDYQFVKKNGEVLETLLSGISEKDNSGNVIRSLAVITDITERKKAELALKENEADLIKLNAEKDKFFSIIAHDLRSPFTGFLGFTELLTEDLHKMTLEDLQKIANNLNKSANNLYGLFTNLLDWTSMQMKRIDFIPKTILLKNVFEIILIDYKILLENKELITNLNIPDDLSVYADVNMLNTICRNLISNSIKFSNRKRNISISAKHSDKNVLICVQDDGIGMDKYILTNLFVLSADIKRKGTENELSTGLGLLLCKDFVEKNGGKIWAESEEGKGSKFYFTLPVGKEEIN